MSLKKIAQTPTLNLHTRILRKLNSHFALEHRYRLYVSQRYISKTSVVIQSQSR